MAGFHLLAYSEAGLAAGATDTDVNLATDEEFSARNNHPVFTEDYQMLAACVIETSITRARLNVPKINGIGRHQIWPVERSATIPDEPGVDDYRDDPIALPRYEEIAVELTNDLGAATEVGNTFIWIARPTWNRNLPRGLQRLTLRATAALTGVAQLWSGAGELTLIENLRNGNYTIVGANAFDAGSLAFRFIERDQPAGTVRRLRPGGLCQEAIGNTPWRPQRGGLGPWLTFHGFAPPAVQVLANAAGATTLELRLDCIWHGEGPPLV